MDIVSQAIIAGLLLAVLLGTVQTIIQKYDSKSGK